jgi:hypothetical protein
MASNPLSTTRKNVAPTQHPMHAHAQLWQHVQNMPPDQLEQATAAASYGVPILGALASNPKTTRKDVIKAAADAAGAGKIPPSQAVDLISQMPDDPTKLQPWLHALYAAHLTALVHMKARALGNQPPPQGAPQ